MRLLFLLIALTGAVLRPAWAAEPAVRWEVGAAAPLTGNAFLEIGLRYEHCRPAKTPRPEFPPRLAVAATHETPALLLKGLTLSRGSLRSFLVWCDPDTTRLDLPALTVKTTAGDQKVPAMGVRLAPAQQKMPVINAPTFLRAKPNLPDRSLWRGELIALTYTIEGSLAAEGKLVAKNPSPVASKSWLLVSQPAPGAAARFRWDIALKVPDEASLSTVFVQEVQWRSPDHQARRAHLITALSPVSVRPLPSPPSSFQGAIGRFQLNARTEANADSQEIRLFISGAGSLPAAAFPRPIPDSCAAVTALETPADVWLVEANQRMTSTLSAKPVGNGKCLLAWAPFCYFDPAAGAYFQLSPSPVKIGGHP